MVIDSDFCDIVSLEGITGSDSSVSFADDIISLQGYDSGFINMTVYVDGKGFQTIPVDIDAYLEELKMEVLFKDPCKYGHMLALKETVPATFDADGSTEYWYCDKCGRAYDVVDWWHQKEIALEDTVIKKIGTVSLDKTSYTYNGSVQKSLH